ncbi:hypothetical protein KJ885_00130 [Patescibacteria group bacterium]|nr:hypothetical protein [Patescibacteria group bacterium]
MGAFRSDREVHIERLRVALQGMPKEQWDEYLEEAKARFPNVEVSAEELEKFFDAKLQTLEERGCIEHIRELLANQRDSVLDKASKMVMGEGNILFLPAVLRIYLSPYSQMDMVVHGGKRGRNYLNPSAITDKVETPEEPYWFFDVEDGTATLGKSPEQAEKILKKQSRSPHTVAEDMALAVHTDVLSRHYVWAAGSRYGSSGGVPVVCLSDDGPKLCWCCAGVADELWGSPSCGSRGL